MRTGVLGGACAAAPTDVSRALPSTAARGLQPAVWDRTNEAHGGSACGASKIYHPLYLCGRRADVASARVIITPYSERVLYSDVIYTFPRCRTFTPTGIPLHPPIHPARHSTTQPFVLTHTARALHPISQPAPPARHP